MMHIYLNGDGTTQLNLPVQSVIQPDIFDEDILKRAIMDIEDLYKVEGLAMYSRQHGVKSPASLSNGVKALILCYYFAKGKFDELVSNACMGANCGPYLQELSCKYDFPIAWDYYLAMDFDKPVNAKDVGTGTIFTDARELIEFYRGLGGAPDVPAVKYTGQLL